MIDKAAAELIGTAILLFTIQVSVAQNAAFAPIAIGGILVAIIFAGGWVVSHTYFLNTLIDNMMTV